MPLSRADHEQVAAAVTGASPERQREMKAHAEATLAEINTIMGQRLLSRDENKASEIAIEILVRLECAENGKGWWFRAKRRPQLVQMYLGGSAPFSALIKGDVSDDAVRLKTLTDLALAKYRPLSLDQLRAALDGDFPIDHREVTHDMATFVFPEVQEFVFMLTLPQGGLAVMGRGKYEGVMLFASAEDHWHCQVSDGTFRAATAGAKKLARVMEKKFSVRDLTKQLGEWIR